MLKKTDEKTTVLRGDNIKARLALFVERIDRLEAERKDINDAIDCIYKEAKHDQFNVKAVREVVRLKKLTAGARFDEREALDIYLKAMNLE